MNVLKVYFDESIDQRSPVQVDYNRIVKYNEKGEEVVIYQEVDYPSFQKSLGKAINWNLNELLKAGVNPDFSISTGFGTRLEGVGVIADFASQVDAILKESNESN